MENLKDQFLDKHKYSPNTFLTNKILVHLITNSSDNKQIISLVTEFKCIASPVI